MDLFNITSDTTTELIPYYKTKGAVSSIRFSNTHATTSVRIRLYIEGDHGVENIYYLLDTNIPGGVTLLLNDSINFDNSTMRMAVATSGGALSASSPLTVIIR